MRQVANECDAKERIRREKIIANAKNNPNYGMRGKNHSEETKKKMSLAWKYDRHVTKEGREKISKVLKGKMPKNIEQLKRVNIGRKFTKEHRNKLSVAQKRRFKLNPMGEENGG